MSNEIPFWVEKLLEMARESGIKAPEVEKGGCNKVKNSIGKALVK